MKGSAEEAETEGREEAETEEAAAAMLLRMESTLAKISSIIHEMRRGSCLVHAKRIQSSQSTRAVPSECSSAGIR